MSTIDQNVNFEEHQPTKEDICRACGLELDDEVVDALLTGRDLSLQQLTKSHGLAEIGTALIRLDALSVKGAEVEASCKRFIILGGVKVCVAFWRRRDG